MGIEKLYEYCEEKTFVVICILCMYNGWCVLV
jgi:hypothetical protein